MPADDLVRAVALDALGAGVPVGDDAVRIEHEQRVVGDALDEGLEAALGMGAPFGLLDEFGVGAGELGGALGNLGLEQLLVLAQRFLDFAAATDLLLRGAVEPRLVDRDRRLHRDGGDDALGAVVEHAGLGMTKEQAAQHLAGTRHDRGREIAATGRWPLGWP